MNSLGPVFCSTNLDSLRAELVRIKPQILMLDYDLPNLDGVNGLTGLMNLNPEAKVVILGGPFSDETEWALFRTGVRGCCRRETEREQLKSVMMAVQQGELWIRRSLSWHLLNELVTITQEKNRIKQAVGELLANLTRREYEVLRLAAQGQTNPEIAERTGLARNTVKTYLQGALHKLGARNRVEAIGKASEAGLL